MKTNTILSRRLAGAGCILAFSLAFALEATPATTDHVSLRIDFAATSGRNVTLNAFNLHGQLIDSFVTPDIGGATLQVSALGIHSVQFIGTTDSTGAAVDDFAFNPVVAVP